MSLYIGAYYPDRQLDESLFSQSLVKVAANLAKYRQHPLQTSPPYLDIHFMMPGKQESPDFVGMRMHNYDTASSTLRIESAVPARIINSTHAEEYVLAVMQDAVDNASEFFANEEMPFKRDDYLKLIDTVARGENQIAQLVTLN